MNRTKTVLNWAFVMLMIPLTILAVFMLVASILGWKFNPVVSGSMDPVLKEGDVVATQPVNPDDIQVGDIITYKSPQLGKVIVHRVVEKYEGEQVSFVTKGDANESADPYLVPEQNVLNKVDFHIPFMGYATQFIKSGSGIMLLFVLPGLLIAGKRLENIHVRFSSKRKGEKELAPVNVHSSGKAWKTGLGAKEDWLVDKAAS